MRERMTQGAPTDRAGRTWRQCVGCLMPREAKRLAHAGVVKDDQDVPGLPQRDSHVPPGVLAPYVLKYRGHEVAASPLIAGRVHAPSRDPEVVGFVPVRFVIPFQLYLFYEPVADAAGHRQKVRRELIDVDSGTEQDIRCSDR